MVVIPSPTINHGETSIADWCNLAGGLVGFAAVAVAGPELAFLLGATSIVLGIASNIPVLGDSQPHN